MPSFSWDIDRERSENHLSIHASSRYVHHRQSHKKRDWCFFSFPISIKMKRFFPPRSFDLFSECACDDEIEPLFKLGIQNAQSVFLI